MKSSPLLLRDPQDIRHTIENWRAGGERIGFVPTMGALHSGHLALVEEAQKYCTKLVVSIFVNPTQFGAGEDFSRYPRMVDKDMDMLTGQGCDLLWLPDVHHIYPEGFATTVSVAPTLSGVLCGAHRAGHFDGVATVVSILLGVVQPDISCFGEKDYQQLQIIRRIHTDLRLNGQIQPVATVREVDGLALSSRNQYLNADERRIAPALYATLKWVREETENRAASEVLDEARATLINAGFSAVDYCEIRHAQTLELLEENLAGGRIFVAARLGSTRLIDNLEIL